MSAAFVIDGTHLASMAFHRARSIAKQEDQTPYIAPRLYSGMIKKIMSTFGPFNDYYTAWEGKGGSAWRRAKMESYKQEREYPEYLFQSLDNCRKMTQEIAIPVLFTDGAEADDVLFSLAKILKNKGYEVTVISSDRDMIQIVQKGYAAAQWDPVKKTFVQIPEYDIVDYKSLVGDSSDNIPGVKGIGAKRAEKILQEGIETLSKGKQEEFHACKALIDMSLHPRLKEIEEYILKSI